MIILNCLSIIILLIAEIISTVFLVVKFKKAAKKIEELNLKILSTAKTITNTFSKIRNTIHKINKLVLIITDKKFKKIHAIIKFSISLIEVFIFVRTIKLSKGFKTLGFKDIKKILLAKIVKNLVFKFVCN